MKKFLIYFLLLLLTVAVSAQNQKTSIVAMDFYCKGVFVKEVTISAATITTALRNTQMFDVISIEDRNTILRIRNYEVEECRDWACQSQAAKALGVDHYLIGNISQSDNQYIFHMSIINTQTGSVVLQGKKSFDDFGEMIDNLKMMVYEICGFDPSTLTNGDIIVKKKPAKTKMSIKDIAVYSVIGAGAVTTVVGGLFLLDANNYYYQKYKTALDDYNELETRVVADYDEAFSILESNRRTLADKLLPGIIISSAGIVTLVTGVIVMLLPEDMGQPYKGVTLQPVPAGLSLRIKY